MCEHKKHFAQMMNAERWYLSLKINNMKKNVLSQHTLDRMAEKDISEFEIRNVFKDYKIIEFNHKRKGDNRVLIRSNRTINGYNTIISVRLETGCIVTGYKNEDTDRHRTINWSNYDRELDVLQYILDNSNENELKEM